MLVWCYLLILLVLIFYIAVMVNCGRMRVRHKIMAPATTGHPEFERAFRVQMNTLEQIVAFLPALMICAILTSDMLAFILGSGWLVGRILYAQTYMAAAEKRGPGFLISFLSLFGLILAGGYGGIRMLITGPA